MKQHPTPAGATYIESTIAALVVPGLAGVVQYSLEKFGATDRVDTISTFLLIWAISASALFVLLIRRYWLLATATTHTFDRHIAESARTVNTVEFLNTLVGEKLKLERSNILLASEARRIEAELPQGSEVIVICPDPEIEFAELNFIDLARLNICERDISYTFLIRPSQTSFSRTIEARITKDLRGAKKVAAKKRLSFVVLGEKHPEANSLTDVLGQFTITVYKYSEGKSNVLLVAPGFKPPVALVVPGEQSGKLLQALNSYLVGRS